MREKIFRGVAGLIVVLVLWAALSGDAYWDTAGWQGALGFVLFTPVLAAFAVRGKRLADEILWVVTHGIELIVRTPERILEWLSRLVENPERPRLNHGKKPVGSGKPNVTEDEEGDGGMDGWEPP